ncbi:MAG: Bcr/CflA family efflux MFS transporter [Allosphingosinicella sp.]
MTRGIVALLAALSALGSLGIHAFVPALPDVSRDLGAPAGLVQLGISLYLAGLVAGQLGGGWSSDLFGRKRILVIGSILYVAGAFACAVAPEILTFLAGRMIQGIGGACALVVSRAVVADLSSDEETAIHLGRLALIVLLAPTLAPLLGGMLVAIGGWRLIFAVLGTLGVLALAATLAWLSESRAPSPEGGRAAFAAFPRLLSSWHYMRFTTANAAGTIGMFGFLASASFLLVDRYGLAVAETGIAFLLVAASVMTGTLLSGRVEARKSGQGLKVGAALFALGGGLMLALSFAVDHPAALVAPMMVTGLGAGMIGPAALAGALRAADARYKGTASSLFGALQMALGAATTAVVAAFYQPSMFAVAIPVTAAGLLILPIVFLGPRRSR